jgi:hypothetical protein
MVLAMFLPPRATDFVNFLKKNHASRARGAAARV